MSSDGLGPYKALDRLAEGTLGPVWRSTDPYTGEAVVLRVIESPGHKTGGAWARIVKTLPTLQCLEHPGLARVIGVAEANGTKALVEEYVDGVDFDQWLDDQGGTVDTGLLYPVISRVLTALEHARRLDMTHLRINPGKIRIIEARNGQQKARLVGFGLGRAWGSSPTTEDADPVNARYSAPEFWHPLLPVGEATDVYSVGVLMYEALTGRAPFEGATAQEVGQSHLTQPLTKLTDLVEDLPWQLNDTIESALVRHPADRLSHAGLLWLLVEGARRNAIVRPQARHASRKGGKGNDKSAETQPAQAARGMEYNLFADTAEHRLGNEGAPSEGFREEEALLRGDAKTPSSEFEAVGDSEDLQGEDTALFDTRKQAKGPKGGFGGADTATHGIEDLAKARTESVSIPTTLQRVDLGPPIGPKDPAPSGEVNPEEDTGRYEIDADLLNISLDDTGETPSSPDLKAFRPAVPSEEFGTSETVAASVPDALRGIDLGTTLDEEAGTAETVAAEIPSALLGVRLDDGDAETEDDVGTAETTAADIPDFLRGVNLGADD